MERARLREREKEREKAALQQQFQQQRDVSTAASSINARVGPDLTSARHFHLSRSSTPARSGSATPSGVRKGKSEYAPRAVLVEKIRKLTRHRHGEEKIDKLMMDAQEGSGRQREGADVKDAQVAQPNESIEVFKPRKRPGASQAERKFRENLQRKASSLRMAERSSSKTGSVRGKSAVDNPNDWDMESDQLASELEKVALEMTGDLDRQKKPPVSSASSSAQDSPKKPATNGMKYQPRNPGRRTLQVPDTDKPTAMEVSSSDGDLSSDSEADYVYDVFVRRPRDSLMPSAEGTQLFDPSKPFIPSATGPTSLVTAPLPGQIGVVVIEEEDEELWNAYAVEDEEQDEGWNEDDEDSNGKHYMNDVSIPDANRTTSAQPKTILTTTIPKMKSTLMTSLIATRTSTRMRIRMTRMGQGICLDRGGAVMGLEARTRTRIGILEGEVRVEEEVAMFGVGGFEIEGCLPWLFGKMV